MSLWRRLGAVLSGTARAAFEYRILGLAAEAAFFCVLSLPPLLFGLAGAIGFFVSALEVGEIDELRVQILDLAATFLTPDVIAQVIAPTLESVLTQGRVDIVSIGFVLALWSGSLAANVFINTISIMYGQARKRGVLRTRLLSLAAFALFLILGAILIPVVLAGPSLIAAVLPGGLRFLIQAYWPIVTLGSILLITTAFHRAVPERTRWLADLPGAVLTMALWFLGSWLLRVALRETVGSSSIYGPLASPIALLLWLYLTSIAVLLGAALNSSLERVFPRLGRRRGVREPITDAEKAQVEQAENPAETSAASK